MTISTTSSMNATMQNARAQAEAAASQAREQAREAAQLARDQAQALRDQAQAARDQAQAAEAEAAGTSLREAIRQANQIAEEVAAEGVSNGRATQGPATIVIPSDAGEDINISVERDGIRVSQGDQSTTIPIHDVVPRGVVQIAYTIPLAIGLLVVGWPIARAIARWIDRRGTTSSSATRLSAEVQARLDAMERNIDTVAVELERVSEGQRFTSKLLTERMQPPAPDFAAAAREPVSREVGR